MQIMEDERKKVLVIDDSPMTLSSVSGMLGKKYKVYCASSGPKAIDIIEVQPPDLIFLDYAMPGFDGKDTYLFIKQHPGMEDVPIVFLTGVSDVEHVKELLKLKPAGYILKPPTPFKILQTAQKHLG
jgi:CheY-like chemotaxis protein